MIDVYLPYNAQLLDICDVIAAGLGHSLMTLQSGGVRTTDVEFVWRKFGQVTLIFGKRYFCEFWYENPSYERCKLLQCESLEICRLLVQFFGGTVGDCNVKWKSNYKNCPTIDKYLKILNARKLAIKEVVW